MPVRNGSINAGLQRRAELKVLRCTLQLIPPAFVAKTCQPGGAAYFFGNASFASFSSSCTQLFDLIGSKAMISEPAATTMAIAA